MSYGKLSNQPTVFGCSKEGGIMPYEKKKNLWLAYFLADWFIQKDSAKNSWENYWRESR